MSLGGTAQDGLSPAKRPTASPTPQCVGLVIDVVLSPCTDFSVFQPDGDQDGPGLQNTLQSMAQSMARQHRSSSLFTQPI